MKFKKIYIEITNKCNFNCPFCSENTLPKREMGLDEFEHTLKQIKPYTNYIYLHVKGEPLYHSNFNGIISLCEKYDFKVNITTNGSLLKDNIDTLKNRCIRQINISLQSYKNISIVSDILNACDTLSKNTYIIYRFWALNNMILSEDNQKILNFIYNHYQTKENHLAKNVYLSENELFEWPSCQNKEYSDGFCYGSKTHIAILSNGTVVPCCLDANGVINLGNIFQEKLSKILSSERFKNMNVSFNNNKCSEELCKHCTYKNRFKK